MNKNGFTLVELIAVIALISIISLITFPNLGNLMSNNKAKEFEVYEDLMVEYTKMIPKYKNLNCVNLEELINNYNMKKINDKMICNGYVIISSNNLKPYLMCTQDDSKLYETEGYSSLECH